MLYPVGALDGCGGERLACAAGSAAPWVRVSVGVGVGVGVGVRVRVGVGFRVRVGRGG